MIYLILDTNIWLYMANGSDPLSKKDRKNSHFELLSKLKEYANQEDITILVNEVIFDEWDRNKEHTRLNINKLKRKAENPKQLFEEIRKYISTNIDEIELEYIEGLKRSIELNEKHILEVEKFLKEECMLISISDELKIKIFNLATSGKAPFHNKKNNIADASILFSAINHLEGTTLDKESQGIFVSNNSTDFTDGRNLDDFHPDIQKEIGSDSFKFQRMLPAALELSQNLIIELQEYKQGQIDAYLESITFGCRSNLCVHTEDFLPWGHLDGTLDVKYETENLTDPNQLKLFPDLPEKTKLRKRVKVGECSFCETMHIHCPQCHEIISTENEDIIFQCPECYMKLQMIYEKFSIDPFIFVYDCEENSVDN